MMMIDVGYDSLTDGSQLTMHEFDAWTAKEQRAFVCNFFIDRWDELTQKQRAKEISKMPQRCHRCGSTGGWLSPDAGYGYLKLYCSGCAMKVVMNAP